MLLEFHKMHGAGNDFVLIDARGKALELDPSQAGLIADRHLGIGCDQILILREPVDSANRLRYEIFNSNGSQATQCGNGARCIGLYMEMNHEVRTGRFSLESPSGMVSMERCDDGEFEVAMGVPKFDAADVPVNLEASGGWYRLESPWGRLEFGAASMGNPHALVLTEDIGNCEIPEIGKFISTHPAFPEGCNAGFAQLAGPSTIRLRVVERGVGETLACGSGACAAMAILQRWNRCGDVADVLLPGGHLVIKWRGNNEPLTMKGPAKHMFRGIMNE